MGKEQKPCLLWHRTAIKAEERGLKMDNECPLEGICNGSDCLIINGPKVPEKTIYNSQDDKLPSHAVVAVR